MDLFHSPSLLDQSLQTLLTLLGSEYYMKYYLLVLLPVVIVTDGPFSRPTILYKNKRFTLPSLAVNNMRMSLDV